MSIYIYFVQNKVIVSELTVNWTSRHISGAGTNLKKWGHRSGAKVGWHWRAWKKVFGRFPPLFGCKSTISRFGERFRDGQQSLASFLFADLFSYSRPPRVQPFVKMGARTPVPHGVGATEAYNMI